MNKFDVVPKGFVVMFGVWAVVVIGALLGFGWLVLEVVDRITN